MNYAGDSLVSPPRVFSVCNNVSGQLSRNRKLPSQRQRKLRRNDSPDNTALGPFISTKITSHKKFRISNKEHRITKCQEGFPSTFSIPCSTLEILIIWYRLTYQINSYIPDPSYSFSFTDVCNSSARMMASDTSLIDFLRFMLCR